MQVDTEEIREELKYTLIEANSGHHLVSYIVIVMSALMLQLINTNRMIYV